jgi:hypothetical protein
MRERQSQLLLNAGDRPLVLPAVDDLTGNYLVSRSFLPWLNSRLWEGQRHLA